MYQIMKEIPHGTAEACLQIGIDENEFCDQILSTRMDEDFKDISLITKLNGAEYRLLAEGTEIAGRIGGAYSGCFLDHPASKSL
jgi:hypothetical protein